MRRLSPPAPAISTRTSTRRSSRPWSAGTARASDDNQRRPMKVLFLKDVPGTAASGDVKEVALGFARNYLFPRRLATHVTPNALTHVEQSKVAAERRLARVREDAEGLAQRLGAAYINLSARAGEEGRLFGAITNQDVADALEEQYGISVDKRKI